MGKKLDALLGRGFKTKKFKATLTVAISRLAIKKNQHQARFAGARSDVIQMLNLGHHERALNRVDQVIKEQNMLDMFAMLETYCHLLIERVELLEHAKECPEELKEAISSMIYAASRCGQFPELQELRAVYTSRFGKEFVARAVELRNNCGVNSKMIQKLSTRMPSMANRVKVLKEIASENNIALHLEEADLESAEVKREAEKEEDQSNATAANDLGESGLEVKKLMVSEEVGTTEEHSYSMKTRRKYKDVADAAQAAYESAASATEAARAAVELIRADSHDSDDPRHPSPLHGKAVVSAEHIESKLQIIEIKDSRDIEEVDLGVDTKKVLPLKDDYYSEAEDAEKHAESKLEELEQNEKDAVYERSLSTSSMDSADKDANEAKASSSLDGRTRLQGENDVLDETENNRTMLTWPDVRAPSENYISHSLKA